LSLEWTNRAWAVTGVSPAQRQVLVALADHADRAGICWPRQSRLAAMTGLARETVSRNVCALRTKGLIQTHPDGERGLIYQLVSQESRCPPVTQDHRTCDAGSQVPVTQDHRPFKDEPSVEPVNEPLSSEAPCQPVPNREGGRPLREHGRERSVSSERTAKGPGQQEDLFDVGEEQRMRLVRARLTGRHWRALKRCLLEALRRENLPVVDAWLRRFGGWSRERFRRVGSPETYWPVVLEGLVDELLGERAAAEERRRRDEVAARRAEEERARAVAKREASETELRRLRAEFEGLEEGERARIVREAWENVPPALRRFADRSRPLAVGPLRLRVLAALGTFTGNAQGSPQTGCG